MSHQRSRRSLLRTGLVAAVALLLAACAQPPRLPSTTAPTDAWSGRLSLVVDDSAVQPLHASFELQGAADAGQLTLLNPLGNVVATLHWGPDKAELVTSSERRASNSLEGLVQELTGSNVPVPALFDWLRGHATAVAGWEADLSGIADGRLVAHRRMPQPTATLRIVFTH